MIGIFDSGVGGLAVLKEINKLLPDTGVIYLADTKNFPYGEKTDTELFEISKNNINKLIKLGAKIIVIACNSATVTTVSILRDNFDIPIIGVEPAIKMAARKPECKIIGLIATKATVNNHDSEALLTNGQIVIRKEFSELVKKIENDYAKITDKYLEKIFQTLVNKVDCIVLGCTHYYFLKEKLVRLFPEVKFYAPSKEIAKHVVDIVKENKIEFTNGENLFLVTGDDVKFKNIFREIYNEEAIDVRKI